MNTYNNMIELVLWVFINSFSRYSNAYNVKLRQKRKIDCLCPIIKN